MAIALSIVSRLVLLPHSCPSVWGNSNRGRGVKECGEAVPIKGIGLWVNVDCDIGTMVGAERREVLGLEVERAEEADKGAAIAVGFNSILGGGAGQEIIAGHGLPKRWERVVVDICGNEDSDWSKLEISFQNLFL